MGRRTTRRCQKLVSTRHSLPGGLSGRAVSSEALDALHANHKKVMTVPFLPICQRSKGKKRIIILQEMEKKMSSAPWLTPYIPITPPARHTHCGLQGACLSPTRHFASLSHPMNTLPEARTGQWACQGWNGECTPSSPTQDRQAASAVTVCGFTGEPSLFQTAGSQEHTCAVSQPVFAKPGSRSPGITSSLPSSPHICGVSE